MTRIALVVDDSMLIRHTVCRFLEERGFEVHAATNGEEAWAMLSQLSPALVVTDLAMPKMNGHELITAIKGSAQFKNTRIVVVAARRNTADPQFTDQRVDFVVYKDIDIQDQLATALDSIFSPAN